MTRWTVATCKSLPLPVNGLYKRGGDLYRVTQVSKLPEYPSSSVDVRVESVSGSPLYLLRSTTDPFIAVIPNTDMELQIQVALLERGTVQVSLHQWRDDL